MQATFENTSAGDQITLDGTLCHVVDKSDDHIDVAPVSVNRFQWHQPAEFDAANYQHLASREDPAPAKKRK